MQIIKQRTLLSLLLEINTTTIQPIYRASCLLLALRWDDRWSVVSFPFRVWGNPARLVAWRHGESLSLVGWLLCAVMTLEVLPWVPFCFRRWSSFGSELGDMCESSSQMVYGWGALSSALSGSRKSKFVKQRASKQRDYCELGVRFSQRI